MDGSTVDQRAGSRSGRGHKSGSTKDTRASGPERVNTHSGKSQGAQEIQKIFFLYSISY